MLYIIKNINHIPQASATKDFPHSSVHEIGMPYLDNVEVEKPFLHGPYLHRVSGLTDRINACQYHSTSFNSTEYNIRRPSL